MIEKPNRLGELRRASRDSSSRARRTVDPAPNETLTWCLALHAAAGGGSEAGDDPAAERPPEPREPAARVPLPDAVPYIQPTRCTTEVPPLRRLSDGHLVACHWAEEIKGRPTPAAPTRGRLRSPSARSGAGTAARLAPILLGVLARTGRERQRHDTFTANSRRSRIGREL
jgi:hypothetical protein